MKTTRSWTRLLVLVALAAVAAVAAGAAAPSADALLLKRLDYDSGNFRQWTAKQALPGRARIVTRPRRGGGYAARFEVRPGDDPIRSTGERAEVYWLSGERAGTESWWTWSTRFPRAFRPNRGAWNIFTQWASGLHCPPPVSFQVSNRSNAKRVQLRVWGGTVTSCQPSSKRVWNLAPLRRGIWYDFVFHVKWSPYASSGLIEVWLNGRKRVAARVPTLYAGSAGVYPKQGFYRGPSGRTTVILHDRMRRFRP